jgi:SprT-like family
MKAAIVAPAADSASYDTQERNRDPTVTAYGEFIYAYEHLNRLLFGERLPPCLITMQRRGRGYGYFSGERFGTRDGENITDEISLNPRHLRQRAVDEVLSTMAHEMVHLEQFHFGKPGRGRYHNKQWAAWMERIGLIPSHSGRPGGKRIGKSVSHYIEPGGPFDRVCSALLDGGFTLHWGDQLAGQDRHPPPVSKAKFSCPDCHANAWGKPELHLVCGDCGKRMR